MCDSWVSRSSVQVEWESGEERITTIPREHWNPNFQCSLEDDTDEDLGDSDDNLSDKDAFPEDEEDFGSEGEETGGELGEDDLDDSSDEMLDEMPDGKLAFSKEKDRMGTTIPLPGTAANQPRCKVAFEAGKTAKDFFDLVVPSTMIDEWVKCTNLSLNAFFEEDEAMEDSSEFTDFTQIPPNERKLFGKRCPAIARREIYGMLAIFLIMGVAHVRCSRDAYRWGYKWRHVGRRNGPKQMGYQRTSTHLLPSYTRVFQQHLHEPFFNRLHVTK